MSLSREILRLFLRVLASVSVDCVGLEELEELGVAFSKAVMLILSRLLSSFRGRSFVGLTAHLNK